MLLLQQFPWEGFLWPYSSSNSIYFSFKNSLQQKFLLEFKYTVHNVLKYEKVWLKK